MTEGWDVLEGEVDQALDADKILHPYYYFEPFDVEERTKTLKHLARLDGVDLYSENMLKHVGADPHPFQTGYLLSTAFFRALLAGNQVGKSISALIEKIMMLTAEIPIALRYEAGFDTGIKRLVNTDNILRFGRHDSSTGSFLDHNIKTKRPEGWDEWNCGTIKGVGIYPEEKISDYGGEVWIGTFMRAQNNMWWPKLTDPARMVIPQHFINQERGNKGFNVQERCVHLVRDAKLTIISYESGFERFEALKVWACDLDEEPEDPRIIQSAQQHAEWLSLVETPYQGMTYTRDLLFPKQVSPDMKVFHCTQYDSPYQSKKGIDAKKKMMPVWEIGARVWGLHTEIKGKPYFDREKLMGWLQRYTFNSLYAQFVPACEYHGIERDYRITEMKSLMETNVIFSNADEENRKDVWKVYETVQEGVPYIMSTDPAEGSENPDEAQDVCSAIIARPWTEMEKKKVNPSALFKIVATLRSTLPTIPFARVCTHAMRYYNNALLAAETRRGFWNGTFAAETADWPYWYYITTVHDKTERAKQHKGFDPNSKTRNQMYDIVFDWIASHDAKEFPEINDFMLMKELAAAVVGKNKKCDHTSENTLDTATCFGILCYVFKNNSDQIVYNGPIKEEAVLVRNPRVRPQKGFDVGMSMMGYKNSKRGKIL